MQDRYLTVAEVAEMLRISYDKALELMKYSAMESVKIGRQYRVLESKLNAYLYPPKTVKQKLRTRPVYQIIERK
jgi:excisionase family DNA binding protein